VANQNWEKLHYQLFFIGDVERQRYLAKPFFLKFGESVKPDAQILFFIKSFFFLSQDVRQATRRALSDPLLFKHY
jgi:hypothetical protein